MYINLHDSSDERMITHNLVDFLNPKLRSRLPTDALSLPRYEQSEFNCCHNDIILNSLVLCSNQKIPTRLLKNQKKQLW